MKSALFVVNVGNLLTDNSLASIETAVLRWGCDLVIATNFNCELHPACWKTTVFEKSSPLRNHDRVLILDADTVVSQRAPNPFELFPAELLVVVDDRQNFNPRRDKTEADEWKILTGSNYRPERYFNSGFIMADRVHHAELFNIALETCRRFPNLCWHDQTPFNVAAQSLDNRFIRFADSSWNFHNPVGRIPHWWMMRSKYIYHFPGNPDRMKQIEQIQWKI